eukprot:466286-Hanusia_phi.AAC.1
MTKIRRTAGGDRCSLKPGSVGGADGGRISKQHFVQGARRIHKNTCMTLGRRPTQKTEAVSR